MALLPAIVGILAALAAPRAQEPASRPASASLARALEDFRKSGDAAACAALLRAGEDAIPGLLAIADDQEANASYRFGAFDIIGRIGSPKAVEPLIGRLADPWFNIRRCAAAALGLIGDERARKPLEDLAAHDPFTWADDKGVTRYLVREDAKKALEDLSRTKVGKKPLVKEAEIFLEDASKVPPYKGRPFPKNLPWPFPGDFKKQWLYNNYQQATDIYVHAGLDLFHDAGTEVRAVDGGYVAFIATNYPDWTTHHFFVVTEKRGDDLGWCYTHVDPASYTFKVGDAVKRGQVLGKVVKFSVGGKPGTNHLHLNFVRFTKKSDGLYELVSLFDPLQCFDWEDRVAPRISDPVRFVRAGSLEELPKAADGVSLVSGAVDLLAGIADRGFPDQDANWMAAVVTLEIRGEKAKPWRKLVFDGRGEIADPTAVRALFLSGEERQSFPEWRGPEPFYHVLKLTHTDGDGALEPADELQCWDSSERGADGKARFPDGNYEVVVRAWDLKGNQAERRAPARVANGAK